MNIKGTILAIAAIVTAQDPQSDHRSIEIETLRDRNASFEPQIIPKGQTLDDQVLTLYAKGMSTRDITETFEDLYGVEISASLVSKITNNVMVRVVE